VGEAAEPALNTLIPTQNEALRLLGENQGGVQSAGRQRRPLSTVWTQSKLRASLEVRAGWPVPGESRSAFLPE
jgi:hypothetical protein